MELENNAVLESNKVKPFGIQDKIGYMLGDFGNSLLFNFIGSYLLLFYTDAFGISATSVGTLMIVSRVWDAINDPMMGIIVDKRKSRKNGKYRPYMRFMGIPLGILAILTFLAIPNIPESMKLPYAYITYIGFGMAYTAINIPYGSLASVLTNNPLERTSLSNFRTFSGVFSQILVLALTPKLIFDSNGVISGKGFLIATVIYAIIANITCRLCYSMTTERVVFEVKKDNEKVNLGQTLKSLAKNRALIGLMLSSLGSLTAISIPNALNAYLFKDYFKTPELLGIMGIFSTLSTFIALAFSTKLVTKFGKKNVATYTSIICITSYAILLFFPSKNPWLYTGLTFISGIGVGFYLALAWALVGDVMDYQEYLSGKREDGTVYAVYSLSRKLVQAIVGSVCGFSLAAIGYQSGATTQTQQVGESIRLLITAIPLIGFILGALSLKFVYNLSNKKLNEVNEELERRRKL